MYQLCCFWVSAAFPEHLVRGVRISEHGAQAGVAHRVLQVRSVGV